MARGKRRQTTQLTIFDIRTPAKGERVSVYDFHGPPRFCGTVLWVYPDFEDDGDAIEVRVDDPAWPWPHRPMIMVHVAKYGVQWTDQ